MREREEGEVAREREIEKKRDRREIPNKYDFDDDRPSNSPHFVDVLIPLSL